ncbi:MAG: protein-L-isoaspartate(D-aspartate) O-methyltransferase [Candidatus Methanofastidiosia archaeon]
MRKEQLIDYLVRGGYIRSEKVKKAFLKVPRENFVLERYRDVAYIDEPLPIPQGQTISAPSMIALMLEALEPERGDKVLEIGAGSGYNAALIAEIVFQENMITVERIPELVEFAKGNLSNSGYSLKVILGDGTLGHEIEAPYDKIIVTAAAPKIPPPLEKQLKLGGRIAIPVGSHSFFQKFLLGVRTKNGMKEENLGGCAFVPLIGRYGF